MADLQTNWIRTCSLTALLVLTAAAGCGGDDDDSKPTATTAGTGGGTAGSTAGARAGTGGSAPPAVTTVACGTAQCAPPPNPAAALLSGFGGGAQGGLSLPGVPQPAGCCLDEASATCGVTTTGSSLCEPIATVDTRCPSLDLGPLGGLLGGGGNLGCCINNACGQDGALLGRGCVENSEAAAMIGAIPIIGAMAQVPTARACDAPDITPPTNNGDDAGAGDSDAGI